MKPANSFRRILFVFTLAGAAAVTVSRVAAQDNNKPVAAEASSAAAQSAAKPDGDYVGAEVCVTCHADQQKSFVHTIMGNAMAHAKTPLEMLGLRSLPWTGQGPRGSGGRQRYDPCPLHQGFQHSCRGTKLGLPVLPHQRQSDVLAGQPARVAGHGLRGLPQRPLWQPGRTICGAGFTESRYGAPLTEHVGTKKPQPELCLQCHQMRRAQLQRSSHMPYREGKVTCTSCHNPHGSPNPSQLLQSTINENCISCHTERRGPVPVGASPGHGELRQLPRAARQQQSTIAEGADAAGLRLLPRCEPSPHAAAAARFDQELQPGLHQLPLSDSLVRITLREISFCVSRRER